MIKIISVNLTPKQVETNGKVQISVEIKKSSPYPYDYKYEYAKPKERGID